MAQEEQRYSNSSSGGGGGGGGGGGNRSSSSKKAKQNKNPQRGLGVAELERIRLEDEQKKDAVNILPPTIPIISPTHSSSGLAVQRPNFRPNNNNNKMSPSAMPLPPQSPTDLSLPNQIFRPPPPPPPSLIPNLSKNMNYTGGELMGFPAGPMQGNLFKFLNPEYSNIEGENPGFGGFRSNRSLPYESNTTTTMAPIWPPPNVMERSHQFQQPFPLSMVNVSSLGTSSSSVMNFQMEPPSNQSYCGNTYTTTMWPEEDKMVVGMKRQYPFSIENAPGPGKFPPAPPPPTYLSRSNESVSCSHGITTTNIEPPNPVFREVPLGSGGIIGRNPKRIMTEAGGLHGDILTLAPPTDSNASSRVKHPHELSESIPYQGGVEDPIYGPGPGGSIQPPFFNFLPPVETQNGESASNTSSSRNGERGENVDLNLKL